MPGFTAKLELPEYIPKEQILGKHVFDSEVVYVGVVRDWTYSPDGQIKLVINTEGTDRKDGGILIPFSFISKVGQFILLKVSKSKFGENVKIEGRDAEKEEEYSKIRPSEMKYFTEIDEKKLNAIIKRKIEPPQE